jgi:hypothetical protein
LGRVQTCKFWKWNLFRFWKKFNSRWS